MRIYTESLDSYSGTNHSAETTRYFGRAQRLRRAAMFSPDRCAALVARIDGATAGPHNTVCVPFKRAVASAHKSKALVKGGGLVYVQTGKDFGSNGLQTVVEPPCDENLDYVYKLPAPTEARGADSAPKKRRLVCLWRKEDKRCWLVGEVGPKAKTLTVSSTKRMAMLVGRGKEGRVYVPRERGIGETVTEMGKNDGLLCMQFVGYEGWRTLGNSKEFFAGWDQFQDLVRYCGYVDMDLPDDTASEILAGKRELIRGRGCKKFTDDADKTAKQKLKAELEEFYRELREKHRDITLGAALELMPAIMEVCENAIEIAKKTGGVALFSGNKGAHVLFRAHELFMHVQSEQRFDLETTKLLRKYLVDKLGKETPLGRDMATRDELLDCSVYRRSTGLAPRGFKARKHARGLWPLQLWPLKKGDAGVGLGARLFQPDESQGSATLQKSVIDWMSWVWKKCPAPGAPGLQRVVTDKLRKRAKRAPDSPQLCALVRRWVEKHGLVQCNGSRGDRTLARRVSVQTEQFANREFGATASQMEAVVEHTILAYFQARAAGATNPETENIPLNERYGDKDRTAPCLRLVLDIDGHALRHRDFVAMRDALVAVVGPAASRAVVCASTDPAKHGEKWHVAFPDLALECGSGRFKLVCEQLELELKQSGTGGTYWKARPACVDETHDDYKREQLLDRAVYSSCLRAPLVPKKHGGSGKHCYVPITVLNGDDVHSLPLEVWNSAAPLEPATARRMQRAARLAFVCPAPGQVATVVPRLEKHIAKLRQKRKDEMRDVRESAKRVKYGCFMSPRGNIVEVDEYEPMTDAFCVAATQRYLQAPGTLCSEADAQIPASDFRVRAGKDGDAWVDYTPRRWQLCECNMGTHSGSAQVGWHVYMSNDGFPKIREHCQSDKCRSMDSAQRNARAPAYVIRTGAGLMAPV